MNTRDRLLLHTIDAATPPSLPRASRTLRAFTMACAFFACFVVGIVFAFIIAGAPSCAP